MMLLSLVTLGCVGAPARPFDNDTAGPSGLGEALDTGSATDLDDDFRPDAADLVDHDVSQVWPDATLEGTRDVFNPDGSLLGELRTYRVGPEGPRHGDGLFQGPEFISVLVADDPELPLWLMATSGAPVGLPEVGDLVYVPTSLAWFIRGEDGELRILEGEPADEVPVRAAPASMVDAMENLANREAAEREFVTAVAACGGTYGTSLGSLWSTTAYSNGSCSGSGSGSYQCVEFIDRLHRNTASHSGNANTYDDGNNARRMNMYKFSNGSLTPQIGDVCVSNGGSYGHVCAVYSLASSTATVIHQNWSSSSATLGVSRSSNTLGSLSSSYSIANLLRPGWDFGSAIDTTSSIYGWSVRNASITTVDSTGFTINPSSDPGLTSPSGLQLDPTRYTKLTIRMKSRAPDGNVRVYFTTSSYTSWREVQAESATVTADGTWRDVTINFGVNGYWVYGGRVNQIRIDPASNGNSGSSDTISIDRAWFTY